MENRKSGFQYRGEFEPQESVMICWVADEYAAKNYNAHAVFVEVIKHLVDQVQVIVNCGVENTLLDCKTKLEKADVNISKIIFTEHEEVLNWARDYGADIIRDESNNKRLIDFNFNTYGLEDPSAEFNVMSKTFAEHHANIVESKETLSSDIITEGGNKEFNGNGILMTIEETEVNKRNPLMTKEEIESEYKTLFNLDKVIWLPQSSFEDEDLFDGVLDIVDGKSVYRSISANGHIDEMCRFVAEDTVILADLTENEAEELESARITKNRLDAAYRILEKETTRDGKALKIIRIPTPEPIYFEATPDDAIFKLWDMYKDISNIGDTLRDGSPYPTGNITMQPAMSYCNFLIANDIVLGQKYYKEGLPLVIKEKDEEAKLVLESVFPNKEVIMIDTIGLNILGGGIHCITKNVSK